MPELFKFADIGMCCFYIVTEFLCLHGIKKYEKAILPPWSQLVIAPFEFAVVLFYIIRHATINYSFFSYLAWAIIEILIVRYYFKYNSISEKMKKWYIIILGIHTVFLLFCILLSNAAFAFFGVFNTLIASVIWYVFILKPSYPIIPFTFIVFIFKFLADAIGCIPYVSSSAIINSIILITLTLVDICFFPTWFILHKKRRQTEPQTEIITKKQKEIESNSRKPLQTVSQKKYSKGWQSTKKKYKKKK